MNAKKFSDAMSELDTKYVDEALNYKKKAKKPIWVKWGSMAACLCLVVVTALLAVNAYASSNNEALLEIDTIPPDGLTMTIVDAAPDDAEFHIVNNTEFQVIYGKANRIEKHDGENWVEVTTESVGIFPATTVTLQPEDEMYGMCGWVSKKLILDAGTYRYLLVVEVQGTDSGTYPIVLKAEFEIE